MVGRCRALHMLVLGLLVGLVASVLVTPAASVGPAGLELRSSQQLSARLTQLRVYSPALAHDANVRVLTPDGFDPDRDHLPVLWLLHGGFGSSAEWTTVGDGEALTAHFPMIVVMPDGGTGGWYTDWRRGTSEGRSAGRRSTSTSFAHQGLPGDVFGLPLLEEPRWREHNPVDLAANLRSVEIQLRTGNGQPGGPHGGSLDPQEMGVSQATATLHARLDTLAIPHLYIDYGPGAHTWPYWRDDLAATLPGIAAFFCPSSRATPRRATQTNRGSSRQRAGRQPARRYCGTTS